MFFIASSSSIYTKFGTQSVYQMMQKNILKFEYSLLMRRSSLDKKDLKTSIQAGSLAQPSSQLTFNAKVAKATTALTTIMTKCPHQMVHLVSVVKCRCLYSSILRSSFFGVEKFARARRTNKDVVSMGLMTTLSTLKPCLAT